MKKNKLFNPDELRLYFVWYIIIIYTLDLISTYLAMQGGGTESNPVIRYFLSSGDSGYMLTFFFFLSLTLIFFLLTESLSYSLSKNYSKDVVYISCYCSVMAMFTIVQISNIVGNLFIYFL